MFHQYLRFPIESDSKDKFSRSTSIIFMTVLGAYRMERMRKRSLRGRRRRGEERKKEVSEENLTTITLTVGKINS